MNAYYPLLALNNSQETFADKYGVKRFTSRIGIVLLIAVMAFVAPLARATCTDDCNTNAAIDDAAAGAAYGVAVVACGASGPGYPLCLSAATITLGIAIAAIEAHRQVCIAACPKE